MMTPLLLDLNLHSTKLPRLRAFKRVQIFHDETADSQCPWSCILQTEVDLGT